MSNLRTLTRKSKSIRRGPFTALSIALVQGKKDAAMQRAGEMVFVRGDAGFYYCTPKAVRTTDATISTYFYLHTCWSYPI